MSAPFDVHDRNSYYFGNMSRKEATDILMNERECGVFLVRDSSTIIGDFVLSVKEVIFVFSLLQLVADNIAKEMGPEWTSALHIEMLIPSAELARKSPQLYVNIKDALLE